MDKIKLVANKEGKLEIIDNLHSLLNNEDSADKTAFFFLSSQLKENTLKNNLLFYNISCNNIIVKEIQDYAEDFLHLNINFTPVLIYINKPKEKFSILPVFYTFKGIKL